MISTLQKEKALCPRGCTTPFEHTLHKWEPVLANPTFQREAIALGKAILRSDPIQRAVRFLDELCKTPPVPSGKTSPPPVPFTESFGTTGERAGD